MTCARAVGWWLLSGVATDVALRAGSVEVDTDPTYGPPPDSLRDSVRFHAAVIAGGPLGAALAGWATFVSWVDDRRAAR